MSKVWSPEEDKSAKSTRWRCTINNPTPDDRERIKNVPDWCAWIEGQEETGEQGTVHYQAAILTKRQVRWSQLRQWLPRAWLKPPISNEHWQNTLAYVRKTETRTGEQFRYENHTEYVSPTSFPRWLRAKWEEYAANENIPDDAIPAGSAPAITKAAWTVHMATQQGIDILHLWLNPQLRKAVSDPYLWSAVAPARREDSDEDQARSALEFALRVSREYA